MHEPVVFVLFVNVQLKLELDVPLRLGFEQVTVSLLVVAVVKDDLVPVVPVGTPKLEYVPEKEPNVEHL